MSNANCPSCQTNLKFEDKVFATFVSCPNTACRYFKVEYPKGCCNNPILKLTRHYKDFDEAMIESDNYTVVNQCQNCGKRVGSALKKDLSHKNKLPTFDTQLLEQREEKLETFRSELVSLDKNRQEIKRQKFWDDYSEYLSGDRWKKIREIVLVRDKHICQSCLNAPATEVHHTAGQFRKNEPIFSLVSVCNRCHEIITEIERGKPENAQLIKYDFDS